MRLGPPRLQYTTSGPVGRAGADEGEGVTEAVSGVSEASMSVGRGQGRRSAKGLVKGRTGPARAKRVREQQSQTRCRRSWHFRRPLKCPKNSITQWSNLLRT